MEQNCCRCYLSQNYIRFFFLFLAPDFFPRSVIPSACLHLVSRCIRSKVWQKHTRGPHPEKVNLSAFVIYTDRHGDNDDNRSVPAGECSGDEVSNLRRLRRQARNGTERSQFHFFPGSMISRRVQSLPKVHIRSCAPLQQQQQLFSTHGPYRDIAPRTFRGTFTRARNGRL